MLSATVGVSDGTRAAATTVTAVTATILALLEASAHVGDFRLSLTVGVKPRLVARVHVGVKTATTGER